MQAISKPRALTWFTRLAFWKRSKIMNVCFQKLGACSSLVDSWLGLLLTAIVLGIGSAIGERVSIGTAVPATWRRSLGLRPRWSGLALGNRRFAVGGRFPQE